MDIRLDDIASQSSAHTPRHANILPIATKPLRGLGGSTYPTTIKDDGCLRAAVKHAQACENGGALGNSQIGFPVSNSGQSGRAKRYELRNGLRRVTSLRRIKFCGAVPVDNFVSLKAAPDGSRAGYGGLSTCASVWCCPVCAAKIAARRKTELEEAVSWATNNGYFVSLLTLTQRHHKGQQLKNLWAGLSQAWNKVTSGRRWVEFKRQLGLVGWVKAVEATIGPHGWHLHQHVLIFTRENPLITPVYWQRKQGRRRTPYPLEVIMPSDFIADRWEAGLARHNIDFLRHSGGLDWQLCKPGDETKLAGYVGKMSNFSGTADSLSSEATLGAFKQARGENRTPFQLLTDVINLGLVEDVTLWRTWEKVSHGKRALTWSMGLRDLVQLGQEQSDEDIAAEENGDEAVAHFDRNAWKLLRQIGEAELLDICERDGIKAAFAWLKAKEVPFIPVWEPASAPPLECLPPLPLE